MACAKRGMRESAMPRFLEQFPHWDRYVLLLGAGASKDSGMPIIRDFSDPAFVAEIVESRAKRLPGFTRPDLMRTCERIRASGLGFEQLLAEFHRSVDTVSVEELINYYHSILAIADDNAGSGGDPDAPGDPPVLYYLVLGEILRGVPQPVIITFNHDLYIEIALQTHVHFGTLEERMDFLRVPLAIVDPGPRDPEGRIPLLKLHGSLGFLLCDGCNRLLSGTDNLWYHSTHRCRTCGHAMRPSYVPPLEEKDTNLLPESWDDARETLRETDFLLVMGYSLPPYDLAARDLLSHLNPDAMVYIIDPYFDAIRKNYEFLAPRTIRGVPVSASRFIYQWGIDPSRLRGHW
jgi:hypothetical protein